MKRWILAITGLVMASGSAASAKDLPNIDAFFDAAPAQRAESLEQVQSRARGARVSGFEPRLGVPTFLWGNSSQVDERLKSALGRMSPEQAARVHLGRLAEVYKLHPQAADTLPAVVKDSGKGPIIVTFRNNVGGVEVFRESLKVVMNERRELIAVSGFLSSHAPLEARGSKLSFAMSAPQAVGSAFENLNGERLNAGLLVPTGRAKGPYTYFDFAPGARAQDSVRLVQPARAKRVLFPLANGLVPSWYVELRTAQPGKTDSDYYSYVISARDGRVLFRNNLKASDAFSYRVWAEGAPGFIPHDGPQGLNGTPHPTGLPDGYQAPFIAPNLVTLQNAPYSQNDPWLPAGATETVGNNVDAYVDFDGDDGRDGLDFRADVTAPNTFDRVYDVTQEPFLSEEQVKAAVTQLFYVTNFLHDSWYDSGFDETAGNAQDDNYGRGGLGGDRMLTEAQDFSGIDNANMFTPSDGEQPIMQMYIFTPNPEIALNVISPPAIAGSYAVGTGAFGPTVFDLTAELVDVVDSGGVSTADGCEPFTTNVVGKIAIVNRGNCNFTAKAVNAQAAGAVGTLIVNNAPGPAPGMGGADPTIVIPVFLVAQSDGALIRAELPNGPVTGQMYAESAVYRDGALDNGIVAHEWGHYISNRLIADSNGLINNQGRSMGEGWGDFTALMMMVREADRQQPGNNNFQGVYSAAGYATSGGSNNGYYWGIRRYPYSTDLTKNPLTFKHIANANALPAGIPSNPNYAGTPNAEVHNSGEVWASMLWECYTALLRDTGRLTFAQAQARMKAYLVFAYSITPVAPTFLEARDSLLVAAYVNDPVDFRLFHAAFARRGAGLRAQAPTRGSTTHAGVVEGFATGKDVELGEVELEETEGSCDDDGVLDNKETGVIRLTMYNTGTERTTQTTANVSTTAPGFTFANGGAVTFPAMNPFSSSTVEVAVALDGPAGIRVVDFNITYRDAGQAIPGDRTVVYPVRINTDDVPTASASDNVESNIQAWAATRDEDLEDYLPWLRYPEEPAVNYYYGVDAPTLTDIYLTSPLLQVSQSGGFSFTFLHRYAFEFDQDPVTGDFIFYDGGVIEISTDNGTTWTDIGTSLYDGVLTTGGLNPLENRPALGGISVGYPNWLNVTINLGNAYQGQAVRVRFRVGTDVAVGSVGWDIDNLVFSGITNTPFPVLVAEQNPCGVNSPPVANAGADQTVDEGAAVTLSGSGTDPDGNALTYAWTQTAGPAVTLNNANTATASFTAPQVAANTVLTFSLTVSDGTLSATDTVSVTVRDVPPANRAPVANAGPDQMVDERSNAALDGRGSSDPDNNPLTYAWTQTAGPAVTLNGANTAQPTFTAPEVPANTVLTFSLTVSDGTLSNTDTVNVTVRHINRVPVASAGPDQTVDERSSVTLDGRGSSDPDGDALTYGWTQTAGPSVTLSSASSAQPTFTAPEVTADTVLTFSLMVADGSTPSGSDTVNITVRQVNRAPVANAGADQTVDENTTVTLNGTASSDPDSGTTLTYTWSQTAGPAVTLNGGNTGSPTFTAPQVTADTVLTFSLTVSDGTLSATDTVSITVRNVNRAPVANAGADQTVDENTAVTLSGTASSDPEGDTLSYTWSQTAGPTVTLNGANTGSPSFTAPQVTADTVLTFSLTVSDGTLSATDTVSITVRNVVPQNRAPVANAGADRPVDEGASVTLSSSGSSDPDGDTLSYTWSQTAGPMVTLNGGNTGSPSFTAPQVTADTVLTFSLTVSDGTLSAMDTVSITVRNVNRGPTVSAGTDQTVDEGTSVTLTGNGADADGDTLSYTWTQTAGPSVTLSGANTAQASFTAPNVTADTVLTFQVRVNDATLSATDTVNVTVRNVAQNRAPVANAGPDQAVDEGASVRLEGSGTDPDGNTVTYAWAQQSGPNVTLAGGTTANPTFTAPSVAADTVLVFQLTVSDGTLSHTDTVSITVRNVGQNQNRSPVANAGADQTVDEGATVALSGSGSSDPDGDTLSYAWAQTAGPTVTLSNANTATPGFTAPDVTADTVFTFELTVGDGALSAKDTVSITVRNVVATNRPPVASAGADQTVEEGASVTLSGSGTDPDGDALTYAWTQTAGPSVPLSGGSTATADFSAPDVAANTVLTFTLKVTDAKGASSEDTVSITVTAKTGDGGEDEDGGGCSCSSDSSAAGSLMPLLMIGMALLGRRRQWLRQ